MVAGEVKALEESDLRLLRMLQVRFPLEPEPYRVIAQSLGRSAEDVLGRTAHLKTAGIIREIAGTFDTRRLGYDTTLVAMQVDAGRADEAARVVNKHPGVSHNYLREDQYNLWFTLAVPRGSRLGVSRTVSVIEKAVGSRGTLVLPSLRVFKLDLALAPEGPGTNGRVDTEGRRQESMPSVLEPLDAADRRLVRVLQSDLSVGPAPFERLATKANMQVSALLEGARRLLAQGFMRRYGAIIRHRRAGFRANAMGVWAVAPERVEKVARAMASFKFVSHCYQRPLLPGWPYTLFTMVHARSREECEGMFRTLAEEAGVSDYRVLHTLKEYKKEKVRYFSPAFARWEKEHESAR